MLLVQQSIEIQGLPADCWPYIRLSSQFGGAMWSAGRVPSCCRLSKPELPLYISLYILKILKMQFAYNSSPTEDRASATLNRVIKEPDLANVNYINYIAACIKFEKRIHITHTQL